MIRLAAKVSRSDWRNKPRTFLYVSGLHKNLKIGFNI
jgi:hypothetical protein